MDKDVFDLTLGSKTMFSTNMNKCNECGKPMFGELKQNETMCRCDTASYTREETKYGNFRKNFDIEGYRNWILKKLLLEDEAPTPDNYERELMSVTECGIRKGWVERMGVFFRSLIIKQ